MSIRACSSATAHGAEARVSRQYPEERLGSSRQAPEGHTAPARHALHEQASPTGRRQAGSSQQGSSMSTRSAASGANSKAGRTQARPVAATRLSRLAPFDDRDRVLPAARAPSSRAAPEGEEVNRLTASTTAAIQGSTPRRRRAPSQAPEARPSPRRRLAARRRNRRRPSADRRRGIAANLSPPPPT